MIFEYNYFITSIEEYEKLLERYHDKIEIFKRSIKMNLYLNKDTYIYAFRLDLEKLLGYELVSSDVKIQIIIEKNKLYTIYSTGSTRKKKTAIEQVDL